MSAIFAMLNAEPITDKQYQVLQFMRSFQKAEDNMPNYRQIQEHFGWRSLTAAKNHVLALVNHKRLQRTKNGNFRFTRFSKKSVAPAPLTK